MTYITVTAHEKAEWARMGEAALDTGRWLVGRRYLSASTLPTGQPIPVTRFDELQGPYRAWLCRNEYPAA